MPPKELPAPMSSVEYGGREREHTSVTSCTSVSVHTVAIARFAVIRGMTASLLPDRALSGYLASRP